jgi:four helix bundle protein
MNANDDRFGLDNFELYRAAREYRIKLYSLCRELPSEEKFNLVSQMRRAALSITNNIAEGHGRWFYLDNARFCRIARGSIQEIMDDLNTCHDEHYIANDTIQNLKTEGLALIKRINGYIAYLKRSQQGKDESSLSS